MAYLNIAATDDISTSETATAGINLPVIAHTNPSFVSYKPIGIGKPLSIQIITIYTGVLQDKKGLFKSSKHDLLCVSGVKSFEAFAASPRAINVLQRHTASHSYVDFSAFAAATPYIYYKKSVDEELEFTIELSINSFENGLLDTVCGLFAKAAGLPLFMPAPGKVLAAGQVTDLVKAGGADLFKPVTVLSQTIPIQFTTAGLPVSTAQSIFVYPSGQEHDEEFADYHIETRIINGRPQMRVANSEGDYSGDTPYVIINLDGDEKPELDSWAATLASSSILSEFYSDGGAKPGLEQNFHSAMQLYNDYRYILKAAALGAKLKTLNAGDEGYAETLNLYQALVNNIPQDSPFAPQLAGLLS